MSTLGVGYTIVGALILLVSSFTALVVVSRLAGTTVSKKVSADSSWREGFRLVVKIRPVWVLILCSGALYLAFSPIVVLMPAWAQDQLRTTPQGYGALEAVLPVGMGLGGSIAANISRRFGDMAALVAGAIGAGVALMVLSLQSSLLGTLTALMLVGVPTAVCQVAMMSKLQGITADHFRGRVFGVLNTITALAMPLGMALSGFAAQSMGLQSVWRISGVIFSVVGLMLAVQGRPRRS